MHKATILVVDDDSSIVYLVQSNLEEAGFNTLAAFNGDDAIKYAHDRLPDLMILDLNMPGINGFDVCRHINATLKIPIIMLTARRELKDEIVGLNLGADDYVTKPFRTDNLIAHVTAVLRRSQSDQGCFTCGDLEIDFKAKVVRVRNCEISLSPTEYRLLEELSANAGEALTDKHLLTKVWGPDYTDDRQYLYEYIKRLRAKIEPNPAKPIFIIIVPGVGYRFDRDKKRNDSA